MLFLLLLDCLPSSTGGNPPGTVDPKLICPLSNIIYPCIPERYCVKLGFSSAFKVGAILWDIQENRRLPLQSGQKTKQKQTYKQTKQNQSTKKNKQTNKQTNKQKKKKNEHN